LTKITFFIKYLFIYPRFKLILVKGQLARDEIPLYTSSTPFSPKWLPLKICNEKIQKAINYLKDNLKLNENSTIIFKKLNKFFSFCFDTSLK
jgi:hypothetical protein